MPRTKLLRFGGALTRIIDDPRDSDPKAEEGERVLPCTDRFQDRWISREYNGHIFKYGAGLSFHHPFSVLERKISRSVLMHKRNESQAVVEFAPYQKLAWKRKSRQ